MGGREGGRERREGKREGEGEKRETVYGGAWRK